MTKTAPFEPSFADVLATIEAATDLAPRHRTHWVCSLRQIAQAMDKPMEIIPARWMAVHFAIGQLHPARVDSNAKTLANHKSNVRAALLWFSKASGLPGRGAKPSPEYAVLWDRLPGPARMRLSGMLRYCSARQILPGAINETVVDRYMAYRAEVTTLAADDITRRRIARAWNACVGVVEGWPEHRLEEPRLKVLASPAWDEFPERLRADIDDYLGKLTHVRRGIDGKRRRPCKSTTIRTRRVELVAAARMAVREGIPIGNLNSLAALLDPAVVERVRDAYWKADGPEPRTYTIDLGWRLLLAARETGCLDPGAVERLDDIRAELEVYRNNGMTEKNLAVVRQVLSGTIWSEVTSLPAALMAQARAMRDHAPMKAAVTAEIAVAISILTFAPVRIGNLGRIRLNENLIKPGGIDSPYWLVFPDYDVKNRVQLQFPLDEDRTSLIDEYIHDFRSLLLRGSNEAWLFPGEAGGFKDLKTLSRQITERVEHATGLRLTAHQFRHAAAAILLKSRPGEYELVRQLLGHRNIETTIRFYCGLVGMQASEIFGEIIRKQMKFEPEPE